MVTHGERRSARAFCRFAAAASLKCCWRIPADPTGRRKMPAPGRSLKGLVDPGEELLAAALREFTEETGFVASEPFIPLAPVKQKSGKVVHAFACAGDFDPGQAGLQHLRN